MFFSALRRLAAFAALAVLTIAAAQADDTDMDFPDGWFAGGEPDAAVTPAQAADQIKTVYDLLDRNIFDRQLTAEKRARAQQAALAAIADGRTLTRDTVGKAIEASLQTVGYSHLHLFPPEVARMIADMTEGKDDGKPVPPAVEAKTIGDIGVLRVNSFMVPVVTQKALASGYARLAEAKILLIDLSGNGGGNFSPVVALAQRLVGPGKAILRAQYRVAGAPAPIEQYGPLPDAGNHGGGSDNTIGLTHSTVVWLTAKNAPKPVARPVYLLIDGHCGSACEIFAGAVKHHAAARLLGRNTAGAVLGGIAFRPPMKGYMLLIPTSTVYGPGGEFYEGSGVAPDVELPQCQTSGDKSSAEGRKACLDSALAFIGNAAR